MPMKKSRHGLTRCSACRAHVRAGETPSTTECPFCGANLREGRARVVLAAGRGGILAASLLALSACGASSSSEDTTEPEPVTDERNDNTEVAEPDGPEPEGDDQFDPPPSDERVEVEAYGIAPDEAPRPPPREVDEPRDQPMYGIAE